jgi:tetratricopeptide (TPR) repeat protein
MKTKSLLLSFFICMITTLHAQNIQELIENGNIAYEKKDFSTAQHFYQEAITKDLTHQWPQAVFNLGNVFYEQKQYDEAAEQFMNVIRSNAHATLKSMAAYNSGNCYLQRKNYPSAIEWYKQSLRANPGDDDARYNLTYAQSMLSRGMGQTQQESSLKEEPPVAENPPSPPLSQEDLNRISKEVKESENKTVQHLQIPSKQKKTSRDW